MANNTQTSSPYNPINGDTIMVYPGAGGAGVQVPIASIMDTPNQTLFNPTFNGNVVYSPTTLTPTTGTVSWNLMLGSTFTLTPTGSITLNATGLQLGQDITLIILTSGVTSYTITFGTNIRSSSGTLATGTVTGKYFIIQYTSDGANLIETLRTTAV